MSTTDRANGNPLFRVTIHQPWAWAIAHFDGQVGDKSIHGDHGPKRTENRTFAPKSMLPGDFIAIHAGLRVYEEPLKHLRKVFDLEIPLADLVHGSFVAVGRYVNTKKLDGLDPEDPWYTAGAFGWMLDEIRTIDPVESRGQQGIRQVTDADLLRQLRDGWADPMSGDEALDRWRSRDKFR